MPPTFLCRSLISPNVTMSARSSCAGSDIEPNAQLALLGDVVGLPAKEQVRGNALRHGSHPCGADVQQGRGRRRTPRSSRSSRTRPRSRPRWSKRRRRAGPGTIDNGMPNVNSVMAQFEFFSKVMRLVNGTVTKEKLFDLSPATEAAAYLSFEDLQPVHVSRCVGRIGRHRVRRRWIDRIRRSRECRQPLWLTCSAGSSPARSQP